MTSSRHHCENFWPRESRRTPVYKTLAVPWRSHFTTALVSTIGHFVFHDSGVDTPVKLIGLGLIVSVAGQFGDLMLSSIKRDIGIKDMGATIPGHGGLLDRFDSLLLVAPAVFHYVNYFRGFGLDQPARIFSEDKEWEEWVSNGAHPGLSGAQRRQRLLREWGGLEGAIPVSLARDHPFFRNPIAGKFAGENTCRHELRSCLWPTTPAISMLLCSAQSCRRVLLARSFQSRPVILFLPSALRRFSRPRA